MYSFPLSFAFQMEHREDGTQRSGFVMGPWVNLLNQKTQTDFPNECLPL